MALGAIILAAGRGTRMKSDFPKVLHPIAGRPMLSYPLEIAAQIRAKPLCVVVPPHDSEVMKLVKDSGGLPVIQKEARGTGDAVLSAAKVFSNFSGHVVILSGDVPLIEQKTIGAFVARVTQQNATTVGLLSMTLGEPGSYGRIVRDLDGKILRIVEARDASEEELKIPEVNTGVYCVEGAWLFRTLKKVKPQNAKGEYYLTDILSHAFSEGVQILAHPVSSADEFMGINTRVDLARASHVMRCRINEMHMMNGVTLIDGIQTYIDAHVEIGRDTTISPGVSLLGETRVGKGCAIESGVVIQSSIIEDRVHIKAMSVIESSRIGNDAVVGPFARLRPESRLGPEVKVGNFVEIKKSELKRGSKASHLTYLGDATIGAYANIGCGTITCNYDGHSKHRTVIGEGAFIGSDTQFVAPVRVGNGATVGAGSTITENVPAKALALARAPQVVLKSWTPKWKRKKKGRK